MRIEGGKALAWGGRRKTSEWGLGEGQEPVGEKRKMGRTWEYQSQLRDASNQYLTSRRNQD